MIPDIWADEIAGSAGFPDAPTMFASIKALEARTPAIVAEALELGAAEPTFAKGVVACLEHMAGRYVGDVDIERTLGHIATLIEEHAP